MVGSTASVGTSWSDRGTLDLETKDLQSECDALQYASIKFSAKSNGFGTV